MKVDASKPYSLVFCLHLDTELGPLIEPYAVQLNENQTLSLTYQKLYYHTIQAFENVMDRDDKAIIKLTSEYSMEALTKKFCKKPDLRPQEFFAKYVDEKVLNDQIRPYIEERVDRCLELLTEKALYLRGKTGNPAHQLLEIGTEEVTAHFHFHKNEDGTKYYPTFRYRGDKLILLEKNVSIITLKPCRVLMENVVYAFESKLDGKKLKPFFTRWNIEVPKSVETQFYKRFITQIVENHKVIAHGFRIVESESAPIPSLKFEIAWNNEAKLNLYFRYEKDLILASDTKETQVRMEKNGENYTYYKTSRDKNFEDVFKRKLLKLGLIRLEGAGYIPSSPAEEQTFLPSKLVEWLNNNKLMLEEAGFSLIQDSASKNYFLGKIDLDFKIEEKNDWFDVFAQVRFGDYKIPFIKLKKYIINGIREFELPDGRIAILPEAWFSKYKDLLALGAENDDDRLIIKRHHFALIDSIFQSEDSTLPNLKQVNDALRELKENETVACPANFADILRPYQKEGYRWMHFLGKNKFGGVLADDMGLGKTIQTLALLQSARNAILPIAEFAEMPMDGQLNLFGNGSINSKIPPSLIVMPTSLIHNWEYEVKKFAPDLKVLTYTGLDREDKIRHFNKADIILSTYGSVRNDIEILKNYEFNYLILDESQVIKNPLAKVTKAMKIVKARHRLSLTGTPIENSLIDLWSQMSFLNPGMLGSYKFFKDEFVQPIEKKSDEERKKKLKELIQPFILRRTKEEVAKDLPELTEKVYFSQMTEEQETVYNDTRNYYRNKILENIEKFGEKKSQFFILKGLMQLRLIANHPKMNNPDFEGESGKFTDIMNSLENILSENHKVLIFSSFVRHLDLIKAQLNKTETPYAYLTGSTGNRKEIIEKFKKEENRIFLISLKAGGVGLNLTEADYVFVCDPWWNPAAELQAISRAHRIGQDKSVFAYKFISKNTVEEKILQLQEKKLRLSTDIIQTNSIEKMISMDDVNMLFS